MAIDMSAAKAPPRKTVAARSTTPPKPAPTTPPVSDNERRRNGLNGLGQLAQGICLLTGQYADAAAIGRYWEPIAAETANVSDQYESVAKPVDILIQIGPFAALLTAVLPLGMQIAANHRMINAEMLVGQGIVSPETLTAQMKAEMARMQMEAMMAEKQARIQAQRIQAEYEALMADETAGAPA